MNQIVEAHEADHTVNDLARKFRCLRVAINAVFKHRGVALYRLSPSDAQIAEMIRLYESGRSFSQVGERRGVIAATVMRRIRATIKKVRSSHQ